MLEIIKWLIFLEKLAYDFYTAAAVYFKDDKNLSELLQSMAIDESYHYDVMEKAAQYVSENNIQMTPDFTLDETTKKRIHAPFEINFEKLKNNSLTEDDIFNCLLNTEFSEWNDIYVYVVNSLSNQMVEYQIASANIQHHISKLGYYFNSSSDLRKYYDEIIKLPKVWNSRILVVDDEEPIRKFLTTILKKYYDIIETAENGEEGYSRILNNYYDVIISDINMPLMNGMEMFSKIILNPLFNRDSIIFLSGSTESLQFIEENKLKYLDKPFNINKLLDLVSGIIKKKI